MKTIWKYTLIATEEQTINAPEGAQVLSVQVQYGVPVLWALVDPEARKEAREIRMHGTGHPISDGLDGYTFIDTIQMAKGELVFHFFVRTALK